jgi:hypothetical protein
MGKEVANLVNNEKSPGEYRINFNAAEYGLSSGVYIYRLITNEFTDTKKMIFLK